MPEPIIPTIGRRVWFFLKPGKLPNADFHVIDVKQPCDAGVVYVWSDALVNLDVTDHYGHHHKFTSVPLRQAGDPEPPTGWWAEWMPYQVKAAKTDRVAELNRTEPDPYVAPHGDTLG